MEKLKRLFGKLGSLGALAMQHLKLLVQADQATVDVALVTKEEVLQLAAKALTPAYQLSGQHRQFVVDQIITMPVEEKNIIDDNYGKLKGRW